ncbi:MAG: hypothetical protein DHS20C02_01610 [Micavibrio sp.]|nr:MAG: hypothetical protein DHS20C02_01610 [Micavibrio sp.]
MESELPQILRLVLALAFVLALMGGLALLLKRFGLSTGMKTSNGVKRLKVIEALPLDARHRAILLERDDKQHLVILGPNGETVVENDIKPKKSNEKTPSKTIQ